MDAEIIKAIVDELQVVLAGRTAGKLYQLMPLSLGFDFRLRDGRYLFISADPAGPRIYLVNRRVRELEKQSGPLSPFALLLRKELNGQTVQSITKDPDDRVVRLRSSGKDELGKHRERTLVVQLTGRAANLFLVDESETILGLMRPSQRSGQQLGERYQPPGQPSRKAPSPRESELLNQVRGAASASAAADTYYEALANRQDLAARAAAVRARLQRKISHAEKLLQQLEHDLSSHDDADRNKRIGDLLLANLSTAERQGELVRLIDYFDDRTPVIEIEVDEHSTLQEEAARRFARFSRSKRAVEKIKARMATVESDLNHIRAEWNQLNDAIANHDEAALEALAPTGRAMDKSPRAARQAKEKITGVRRYVSSDGLDILVGRTAKDNDNLTFKVARPNDLWLHTSDYPGSHVVVRNPSRKDIPQRTIIEAAQLAAFYSHARKDAKVVVHYTPRKFLTKPKGAALGLVRLARSKTIIVEPGETVKRK